MRKFSTLLFLLVFTVFTSATAQVDVPVGTGTGTNTETGYPVPLQDYYEGSRAQYLFRASELTAAGMGPGIITAIKWNVVAVNDAGLIEKFSLSIGTTPVNTLSTSAWDPVNNAITTPQVDYQPLLGINTFALPSPFFWDGVSNIIIEVCNGEPGNATGLWYTENPLMPYTTGLSFNGSHTYRADNAGNLCGTGTTTNTGTQTIRPNTIFSWTPASTCSGAPNAGSAVSTTGTIMCANAQFTLSLSGATIASGLTYQWQSSIDNVSFSDIANATSSSLTTTQTGTVMYYRAIVSCSGPSDTSSAVQVTYSAAPVYAPVPYTESFESTWINACNTRELPNQYWRNTPGTGNPSWRRNDDGASAAWTNATGGYTPTASAGTYSARFHSDAATNGQKGQLDFYFNGNTPATAKRLMFDVINTNGNDSLVILLSTDGGTTFTRLDSVLTSATWRTKTIVFNTTSATSVLRFEGVADGGTSDIGIDNIILTNFADCSGTPDGGTTSSTKSNVCVGETFVLSFTGATDGNGISYQWQASTDGGVTWNNIAGATGLTYTTTQVMATQYRVLVSCSFSATSTPSVPVLVSSPTPVVGNYTINNSLPTDIAARRFASFNDAYNFIKCGIAGPVVFNVETGTGQYTEQLVMDAVPGTSATNTVTFKGNGVASIGFASTNTAQRGVIKLRAANHIIFDSLIINATTGTYGIGVHLVNTATGDGADSNSIRNCTINLNMTGNNANFAGIVVSGSDSDPVAVGSNVVADGNTFENNTIIGGYYGITLTATFTGGANGNNRIVRNEIRDFYLTGIYIAGSYGTVVERNMIHRPTRTPVGEFTGILFTTQKSTLASVYKNRIKNPYGGMPTSASAFNGISWINAAGTAGTGENFVVNNLIYEANGNGAWTAFLNTASPYVYYMHNTVDFDGVSSTSTSATRGFAQTASTAGIFFYNNIISINRGGNGQKHAVHLTGSVPAGMDNNDYYVFPLTGTNYIGFYTTNRRTLADWQAATNVDAASIAINPALTRVGDDRIPGNAGVDNRGQYVGVDDDINNLLRNQATPDIGAHEFTAPLCSVPPVSGTVVVSPTTICQNNPVFLGLNIGAYGSAQTFQWQTSTDSSGTYTNLGVPLSTPDTVIISDVTLWYRVAVTCSGNTVYTAAVKLTVIPALPAGTYTINSAQATTYLGPGTGSNFQTFNEAKNAMSCGILGAVVFNVDPNSGPYTEQLILDSIKGTSPVNTITFNGNGRTIKFSSASSNERAVIKLRGADYIIFDSLVVDATGGSFGYGIQLLSSADTNVVRRSTILLPIGSSSSYAGIVVNATDAGTISAGNTLSDGNTFDSNTIIGGYYSATLVGNTTVAAFIDGNKFTNNTFRDFYFAGLHLTGTSNTLVEGNIFTRPNVVTNPTTVYGINLSQAPSNRLLVTRNRFFNFFTSSTNTNTVSFYGINHNNVKAAAGSENLITNNLIYRIEHNGPLYGFYNSGSDNVRYYHNTLSLDNTASTTTGTTSAFYQTGTALAVEFKNNLITITRGGNGSKYGLYLATPASEVQSNFNNIFVNGGGSNNYFGFSSGNRQTLAAWSAFTSKDTNSLDIEPLYVDSANGNFAPGIAPLNDKGTFLGVPVDILLNPRPTVPGGSARPDIGAFEFAPPTCTAPPVPGIATITPNTGVCLETPISLDITGHSSVGSITFQWESSADGVNWTPLSGILFGPKYDTVATTNTYYRAAVTCSTTTRYTPTVQITLGDILPAGTYTISSNPTTYPGGNNFQGFVAAVNAMQCGIGGQIIFNVAPGTYTEQVRVGSIRGVSPARTVTFQAANGDPASVNLTFASTIAANNYTLKLDSTRYFIFKNLTISATSPTLGRAVELASIASYDSIVNCIIETPVTTISSPNLAGIYAATFRGTENVIKGNTIRNGSYGIFFTGAGLAANLTVDHVIDSNIVSGFYNYGIYAAFHKRANIRNNRVTVAAPVSGLSYGIYLNDCDSSFSLVRNQVSINNTVSTVYGIYVNNSDSSIDGRSRIDGNIVNSSGANTGSLYGLYINSSAGHTAVNNVISLNNTGTIAWGLWSNSTNTNYWNNSINLTATSPNNGYAAYFSNSAVTNINIRNNIFSNQGGGRALFVNSMTQSGASNYNMLYATGPVLVQRGTPAAAYTNLEDFSSANLWDTYSIVYPPAFANTSDLRPDLANPDVWAMHGRGVQVPGNSTDINGNPRPTTLTTGVPDMGAYEFLPTALPTVLTATPALPAPNTTQTFMYGTDTVMKVTWGATAPPSVEGRRFSGVVPPNLPAGMDSMYFYTKLESPSGGSYPYDMELFYVESWMGSMPSENQIGLGKTTQSLVNWVIGFSSRNDTRKNAIKQNSLDFFDKFTGLVNPYAPPVIPDRDSSNRGRRFWVAYPVNQLNGGQNQEMVIYLSAQEPATVDVKINGTNWGRTYSVPANSVVVSDLIPKTGPDNAFINQAGFSNRAISITSDVPIVAYAHVYGAASSGASMLMPVGVWGYEYSTLGITQDYGSSSYAYYYVIADRDNTVVEITSTPGVALQNAGMNPGTPFVVNLNRGEFYQVVATSQTQELSGSLIRSIPNAQGECYPIATFSGSSRTGIDQPCGGGGDFIMQQNFPSTAWGKRYLTAPHSMAAAATSTQGSLFRVAVKDPTTVVRRNGTVLTGLQNNFYYQYLSTTADYIEADKPIMVAQFFSGACSGNGDPEMIYLSPIEQAIDRVGFYRNTNEGIDVNYLTMIIPTAGLSSLSIIDGTPGTPVLPDHTYPHPQNALTGNNYTVVVKRWPSAQRQVRVSSDSAFTAITYGLGSVESYGYNAGTLVKTLSANISISHPTDTTQSPAEYNCVGTPFVFTAYLPVKPTSIIWKFSSTPNMTPNADSIIANPVPFDSVVVNGVRYFAFTVNQTFEFSSPGLYPVQVNYTHPDIEGCDKTALNVLYVQVLPPPKFGFDVNFSGCEGSQAQFTGHPQTENLINLTNWTWTFHNGTTVNGQNATLDYPTPGTYDVTLRSITPDGCIGDTTRQIVVNPKPVVNMVADSIAACIGADTAFAVANPLAGATYYWFTSTAGGTPVDSGTRFAITGITAPAEYYVEAVSAAGCTSQVRKRVVLTNFQPLAPTVVTTGPSTLTSVTFNWTPVAGATGYEVSINGQPFVVPSSGSTGLTHTVSNLVGSQSICIVVRAVAANACQNSLSTEVCGCNNASVVVSPDSLAVCNNTSATFNVQNPIAGTQYTWYTAQTGGTQVGTGAVFTTPAITATTEFWVEPSIATGCATPTRTRVVATVLPLLAQPVVAATGSSANSVTFSWAAVTGAVGYQVSTDGGATYTAVSTATTYTAGNLTGFQRVCVLIRAVGSNPCQNSVSQSACGCNVSTVVVAPTTTEVCSGSTATFNVQSPVAGGTYNWYTQATGGTPVFTGSSFTTPVVTSTTEYYLEQAVTGCTSASRTRVVVTLLQPLATPVPTFASATPTSVTFTWPAVAGASGYQVSTDNGATFQPVITGTTYTFTGLTPMQQVSIIVRAVGSSACQNSVSVAVSARALGDQVYIPNTFTPNGDGINDVLAVYGDVVRDVVFMVFNQWGEKVVESRDRNRVWDGTYQGKPQPVGVYIYACKVTLQDGTVIDRKGSINLVR